MLATAASAYCAQNQLQLAHELGRGAFKCAFLVSAGDNTYALKIAEYSGALAERLHREIHALQSCNHPGVATVVAATKFEHGGSQFVVVVEEYLAGVTLEQRQATGSTHADLLHIAASLASVLAHLYPRRLVHRDIKPANILFRGTGELVLTDFGIVRALDAASLTHDFFMQGPGTPLFASPEQLNNEKALIDWRTDQFGLAMTVAYCLLGHHPYEVEGVSTRDAVLSVAKRDAIPASSDEQFSAAGLSFLSRALSPWSVGRYLLPEDLIAAIDGRA